MDIRANETPEQYAKRKAEEFSVSLREYVADRSTENLSATSKALSDSIDADLLAKYAAELG